MSSGKWRHKRDVLERILARTEEQLIVPALGPCLVWRGTLRNGYGYGNIKVDGRSLGTHRVVWERQRGPVPIGLWVLHQCDHRPCVRVEHLFLGTVQANNADRDAKGRNVLSYGEVHGRTKYTDDEVQQIRDLRARGLLHREIAGIIGCSPSYVSNVLHEQVRVSLTGQRRNPSLLVTNGWRTTDER